MIRPRFLFRPNLQKESHRRAWAALQAVPEGQRSAFLVQAILQSSEADLLRRIIREELAAVSVRKNDEKQEDRQKSLPDGMINFLSNLQDD